MELTTHEKGMITELTVQREFIEHGFNVSVPLLPSSRYDMIVDIYGNLIKVQVKTSRPIKNSDGFTFNLRSSRTHRWGVTNEKYTKDDVDLFATVYDNKVYIVPQYLVDGKNQCNLRYTSANNQIHNIMFADDFEFNNVVNSMPRLPVQNNDPLYLL